MNKINVNNVLQDKTVATIAVDGLNPVKCDPNSKRQYNTYNFHH